MLNSALLHFLAHQLHHIPMHDCRIVGHKGPHANRIVNGHEGFYAGTEAAVVLLSQIVRAKVRAFIRY